MEKTMILVDLNNVVISNMMVQMGQKSVPDEGMLRHMILNSLRAWRTKFKNEYGELVLCDDGKHSWRRDIFPEYKANRKKGRDSDYHDWDEIFIILNKIKLELKTIFPYKYICVDHCEADDIIAWICANSKDKILILSGDKDFRQLHRTSNIKQYSPVLKKYITCDDPDMYLKEHILTGDTSDGVPNFLSDDDALSNATKRQTPLRKKKIAECINNLECLNENERRNWERNNAMVNLVDSCIPDKYTEAIAEEFAKEPIGGRKNFIDYFMKNGLKLLFNSLDEF